MSRRMSNDHNNAMRPGPESSDSSDSGSEYSSNDSSNSPAVAPRTPPIPKRVNQKQAPGGRPPRSPAIAVSWNPSGHATRKGFRPELSDQRPNFLRRRDRDYKESIARQTRPAARQGSRQEQTTQAAANRAALYRSPGSEPKTQLPRHRASAGCREGKDTPPGTEKRARSAPSSRRGTPPTPRWRLSPGAPQSPTLPTTIKTALGSPGSPKQAPRKAEAVRREHLSETKQSRTPRYSSTSKNPFSEATAKYVHTILEAMLAPEDFKLLEFFNVLGLLRLYKPSFINTKIYQQLIMTEQLGIDPPTELYASWKVISKDFCKEDDDQSAYQDIFNELAKETIPDPRTNGIKGGKLIGKFLTTAKKNYASHLLASALMAVHAKATTDKSHHERARSLAKHLVASTHNNTHCLHGLLPRKVLRELNIHSYGILGQESVRTCVEAVIRTEKSFKAPLSVCAVQQIIREKSTSLLKDQQKNPQEPEKTPAQIKEQVTKSTLMKQLWGIQRIPILQRLVKSDLQTLSADALLAHYEEISQKSDVIFQGALNLYSFRKLKENTGFETRSEKIEELIRTQMETDDSKFKVSEACQSTLKLIDLLSIFNYTDLAAIKPDTFTILKTIYSEFARVFDRATSHDGEATDGQVRSLPNKEITDRQERFRKLTPTCLRKALLKNRKLLEQTQVLYEEPNLEASLQTNTDQTLFSSPDPTSSHPDIVTAFTAFKEAFSTLACELFGKSVFRCPDHPAYSKKKIKEKMTHVFSLFIHFSCLVLREATDNEILQEIIKESPDFDKLKPELIEPVVPKSDDPKDIEEAQWQEESQAECLHERSYLLQHIGRLFIRQYVRDEEADSTLAETGLTHPSFFLLPNWPNTNLASAIKSEIVKAFQQAGKSQTLPRKYRTLKRTLPKFDMAAVLTAALAMLTIEKTTPETPDAITFPEGTPISVLDKEQKTTVTSNRALTDRNLPLSSYAEDASAKLQAFQRKEVGYIIGICFGFLAGILPGVIALVCYLHTKRVLHNRARQNSALNRAREGLPPHTQDELDQEFTTESAWTSPRRLFLPRKRHGNSHREIQRQNSHLNLQQIQSTPVKDLLALADTQRSASGLS